jgi:hypothetical protein
MLELAVNAGELPHRLRQQHTVQQQADELRRRQNPGRDALPGEPEQREDGSGGDPPDRRDQQGLDALLSHLQCANLLDLFAIALGFRPLARERFDQRQQRFFISL